MPKEISIAFQTDKSAAEYIALAQLVNQYDFDGVTVYCDLPYHTPFGPLMLMAPHLKRARVGVAAISPSRIHPLDIAAQTALLTDLAPAGAYVGFARGAWLEAHGIHEQVPPIQAVREAVEIVRYMLSGSTGGYRGQIYTLADHVHATYPLPKREVPTLIGTWGRQLSAVAGEIADEVKVGGSANPNLISVIQSYIAEGEAKAQRSQGSVRVVMGAVSVVDDDRKRARQLAKRAVALYLPVVAPLDPTLEVEPELIDRLRVCSEQDKIDEAAGLISDSLLDIFAFAGAPHDLIDHALRLFEAGADRIEFGTPHGLRPESGIRIVGSQVLPVLHRNFH